MARPSTFSPEIMARFVDAIEAGASMRLASKAAGISHTTGQRWYAGNPEFCAAVDAACGRRVTRWLRVIETACADDWKAAQWLLERVEPEDFGKSVRTSVQEEIQSFLNGLKTRLGSSAWREVMSAASEQAGPGVLPRRPDSEPAEQH